VTHVDQGPIGRTTRGNPATYLGVYDRIRARFAAAPESLARGYSPRTFSFNVEGGRCPSCEGAGHETVEMQFLADVSFLCPDCHGRRFQDEVLEVRVKGHSVADVLEMSADALMEVFRDDDALVAMLEPMRAVGLGYLRMGQSLSTLSGGEAQRLKLASVLAHAKRGTLVILDEPTTGLHRRDVAVVFDTLDALVARGATVIVVEHDPYVAARADHERLLGATHERFGRLDVLVNKAGLLKPHFATQVNEADLDDMLAVNFKGPFFLSVAALPHLAADGGGAIVNIGALGATQPMEGIGAYCAVKAAMANFATTMAREWAAQGVRVNTLVPGTIATDMIMPADPVKRAQFVENFSKQNLFGRLGEPADLVGGCLFLASDASRFMTGRSLFVDGGMLR